MTSGGPNRRWWWLPFAGLLVALASDGCWLILFPAFALFACARAGLTRWQRVFALLLVALAAVVQWDRRWIGACVRVWVHQDAYLAEIRRLNAAPDAPGTGLGPPWISIESPRRARVTWLAARGDEIGVYYDLDRKPELGTWHLFGPWFFYAH